MEDKAAVTIAALFALVIIEVAAITHDMNGQMLLVVLVIIAGAIGVPIGLRAKDHRIFQ